MPGTDSACGVCACGGMLEATSMLQRAGIMSGCEGPMRWTEELRSHSHCLDSMYEVQCDEGSEPKAS